MDVDDLAHHEYAHVLHFVRHLTSDAALAEDITQQTFLRAWEHRAEVERMARPVGWLLVVARRLVCDTFRRYQVVRFEPLEYATSLETEDIASDLAQWIDVRDAITRLSPTHQRILQQAMLEMSYSEWSQQTGKKQGTLKMALMRARRALSQEVA